MLHGYSVVPHSIFWECRCAQLYSWLAESPGFDPPESWTVMDNSSYYIALIALIALICYYY